MSEGFVKTQRVFMDEAFRKMAERNELFLEMLPTLTRAELAALVENRPSLWGAFSAYLTVNPWPGAPET